GINNSYCINILDFRINIFDAHCHCSSKSLCGFIGIHADFFPDWVVKDNLIARLSFHNSESLIGKLLLQIAVSRLSMEYGYYIYYFGIQLVRIRRYTL
ncbi:MAG: hypothetical protein QOA19_10965, partial [Nitrososphaeraceae archaeon]|nr:hypothetical protein [Nitrososphaeraceae archaeon]MDW0259179.1 hypothetical protein [Nitrososphaeraceae archaeon]